MEPWNTRFLIRAGLATVLSLLGSAQVAVYDGGITAAEGIGIAIAGCIALGGYLGVGLTTPVEPFVGIGKEDKVEVPSPPADEV